VLHENHPSGYWRIDPFEGKEYLVGIHFRHRGGHRKIFTHVGEAERKRLMHRIRYPDSGELSVDTEHIPAEVEKYVEELIAAYFP